MLMCMLTKRTNILFDEKLWEILTRLAQEKKTSVGDLVRKAVEAILRHRPTPVKGKIDYKALINAGRKYY